jgi:hypothetical protein
MFDDFPLDRGVFVKKSSNVLGSNRFCDAVIRRIECLHHQLILSLAFTAWFMGIAD